MSCHDEHHDHDHGHGHDHSHEPPADTYANQSLYEYIEVDALTTLNELEPDMGRKIIKPWNRRLNQTDYLESDVDEQLLIYIPFTGMVRLHSILIRSVADDSAPDVIKVFKNRDDLDFSLASDLKPSAEFRHPEGVGGDILESGDEHDDTDNIDDQARAVPDLQAEGIAEYAVNRALFSNLTSLTLFIESNHGNDTTKLLYIGLRGEWLNVKRNAPVITLYEASANPADHKNIVPGENHVSHSL